LPRTMLLLSNKLRSELPAGSRVVSNCFVFKDWPPAKQEGKVIVYAK